jgi:pimeloyl-ACP methyl ester carboxylesterase
MSHRNFIDTPSGKIAYTDAGSGPAALFFHGAFLNAHQWRDVVPLLSPLRRCIAFDNLGHGYTEVAPDQAVDFEAQAQAAMQLLDALGIEQVDIVGNDSGGGIAQVFAGRNPGRVRSIALTNCETHTNCPPESFKPTIEVIRGGAAPVMAQQMLGSIEFARSPLALGSVFEHPERLTPETVAAYIAPLVRSPEATAAFERFVLSIEPKYTTAVEPALRKLDVPALIAWGTADPTFSPEWADWLAETLPGARPVEWIEGAKLFWPEERPEQLAGLLRELWEAGCR